MISNRYSLNEGGFLASFFVGDNNIRGNDDKTVKKWGGVLQ